MRIAAAALFSALVATAALAQHPPAPGNDNNEDKQRIPWKDTQRSLDEIQRRQQRDAPVLKTPKFLDAVHNFAPGKFPDLNITWGEFITLDGTEFTAFQLAPAGEGYMKPGTRVIAFGEIVDADGKQLLTFEESLGVLQSKRDVFVERTFVLPVTKSVATIGLAAGDEILGVARRTLEPEQLTKTNAGISRVILSNNLYTLAAAQKPLEPFAFGGTKVVPKPDRTFKRDDELWIFAELRNPKVDEKRAPHVTTKIELEGGGRKIKGAPTEAQASPLKGVDGHFGVGQSLDLAALKPGEYTLRFVVTDTLANASWTREETLRIVD